MGRLTGIVDPRQSLHRSIAEHKYAAVWQHSATPCLSGKPTRRDWIDACWLSIAAIFITSSFPKKVESRIHCNAETSLSTSMNSASRRWAWGWKPGGKVKDVGESGSRVQCSSGKVVCEMIRREPVMTEEFRSDLLIVRMSGGKGRVGTRRWHA